VYKCRGGLTESGCGFCSVGGDQGVSYTALVSAGLFVFGFAVRRSRRPRVTSAARGAR
jgi:MYXO-CTERM domain-containing protein